ncbi:hypothetical protein [Lysobacter capsici]|uniref:hypothetical protein n=1 Tax=Lysobacter capsici TaxID=435897 RepID=UPI001C004F13|nr:hypothetical protein [Lysobacter capsici]QWF17767.1 hypothetical protein KME82_02945 [Lysobacter capsici]
MKRSILLGAAVIAAVAGAYFVGRTQVSRPQATAPIGTDSADVAAPGPTPDFNAPPKVIKGGVLPTAGTPLKDTFAKLQARANAGDVDAAGRLLRDLNQCTQLRATQWKNANATDTLTRKSTEGMSPAQLRTYQMLLDAVELRRQAESNSLQLCDGVNDAMLDSLVPNIAQAARLGDERARACYLERGPLYDARSLLKHPDSIRNYRAAATSMIDAGLAKGDWRVVDLLQKAYEPGAQGLLAGVVGTDPAQHYRYLKLYRLGAEQHRIAQLDQQLAAIAANLSPAQRADADDWAQTKLRDFRGPSTNTTPPGWDACEF